MKFNWKRSTSILMALALALSVFAGCGNSTPSSSSAPESSTAASAASESASSTSSTAESSGEKVKLTRWGNIDPNRILPVTDNFKTIKCFQEMEKILNIEIEHIHPPAGQDVEQFNLLRASGNYPDMIYYDWTGKVPGGPQKLIEDGVILDLRETIDTKSPNMKAFYDEHPNLYKQSLTDDGSLYCYPSVFPYWTEEPTLQTVRGNTVRKDWLEDLGMEAPETMDEWYEVLKGFKARGTNADGKTIYPLVSRRLDLRTSAVRCFANAWDGLDYDFYLRDGKVTFGPLEPEFRDYTETMAKWYQEGLIDPGFATYANKEHDAQVSAEIAGAWHSGLGSGLGIFIVSFGDENKVVGTKFPVINKGDTPRFNNASNQAIQGLGTAISGTCKNVDAAVRWLDFHYSKEGYMLMNWGIEGESYEYGADGLPYFTELITDDPEGHAIDIAIGKYTIMEFGANVQDPRINETRMWTWNAQREASAAWDAADFTMRIPPMMTLTTEEGAEIAALMGDISTYRDESFLRFLTGAESMSNYDSFVNQIKAMNIDRVIEIYQQALERYNNRMG